MYSKKLTIAGQVDCVAEYNGKLSVIDFKTANKERQGRLGRKLLFTNKQLMLICTKKHFGTPIEQIVILFG